MKKIGCLLLSCILSFPLYTQESQAAEKFRQGQAAGYATRDATVLSMMGWGLGLVIGIAALCLLIESDSTSNTTTNTQ